MNVTVSIQWEIFSNDLVPAASLAEMTANFCCELSERHQVTVYLDLARWRKVSAGVARVARS